jgi:hypothetical protein
MPIRKDHPNYQAYLAESHRLSQAAEARLKALAAEFGEGEEGVRLARELQVEEAELRRALQERFGLLEDEART